MLKKVLFAFMMFLCVLCGAAIAQETGDFTADKHKAHGIACGDCHGSGPKQAVTKEQCLQCHKSFEVLAEKTKDMAPNPHSSHLPDLKCNKCHRGHEADKNYCTTCHEELKFGRKTAKQ